MAIAEAGEADIVYCTKCDYAANIEIGKPGIMKQDEEVLHELSVVDTPNASSIEAVADKKRKWSNIRKCLDMEWEYHDEKKLWFIL